MKSWQARIGTLLVAILQLAMWGFVAPAHRLAHHSPFGHRHQCGLHSCASHSSTSHSSCAGHSHASAAADTRVTPSRSATGTACRHGGKCCDHRASSQSKPVVPPPTPVGCGHSHPAGHGDGAPCQHDEDGCSLCHLALASCVTVDVAVPLVNAHADSLVAAWNTDWIPTLCVSRFDARGPPVG